MKAVLPIFFIVSFLGVSPSVLAADLSQQEAVEEPVSQPKALEEFSKRFSEIKEGDAEGYYNLAVFCIDNDLPEKAEYLLGEAAKDPAFERRAKRLLEVLTGEPDKILYEAAFKHYESGYLAEAMAEVETLKAAYPKGHYIRKARLLLRKINNEAVDKPYLLVPVTDSAAEFGKIMGSKSEEQKKAYFADVLKKAEYFGDVMAAKSATGAKKEEHLSYAIKCADNVFNLSDDTELKNKTMDLRGRLIKQLFTERPVSEDLKNIDEYYQKLYLVKDNGFIEDVCDKYIKAGEAYLKKARKTSGDEKIGNLVNAYKCFSFANAYTKSEKIKQDTFQKMNLINSEKRKELNKKKK